MELYDPRNPAVEGSYYFLNILPTVAYNLSTYLNYGDLLLVVNDRYIGRIMIVCDKLCSQSKFKNGILKVETPHNAPLGHVVLLNTIVHHFIPFADDGFAVDKQIIYKRENFAGWR